MAEARAYAMRNRQGSDWFGDSSATTSNQAPTPVKEPPVSSPAKNGTDTPSGRTQMIKPTCNSNHWYKYDQTASSSESTPKKGAGKAPRQTTGEWYGSTGAQSTEEKKDSKPRVVSTEGASYCRRDKAGSSANWFTHEHEKGVTPQSSGPRVTSKEGCGNATRMRGESENWFEYTENKPSAVVQSPVHTTKGRGIQPRSSDMHHIFHHSENPGN